MAHKFPPLSGRPVKDTLVLFDVDGTLTPARRTAAPEMLQLLQELRHKVAIGFVGGSDLAKQQEQLGSTGESVIDLFDYCFAENGLTAYRQGTKLPAETFIDHLGEEKYQDLVNFCLHYIADLKIPVKRGTFVEFRAGMINVSPIGRNASVEERNTYERFDKEHHIREIMIQEIHQRFPDIGLTYSIGGQISFDCFPTGWDKTYCLRHVEKDGYKTIHFFGDKTFQGGNDYEIYTDSRVTGHSVDSPTDTMRIIKELFFN